ncbi:DUF4142 domain-containing protein [Stutzerimonas chloritidismutans]|uniref:DUF4142 domain-containing protein n=1 Tax=Stutzerimonas chloritidismutans TaxID=203192 RepID=A0ABU9M5D9_STUCH
MAEASIKGIAEIEAAQLATSESKSQDVETLAQKMMDDHTKANQKLIELARQPDDARNIR